MVANVSFMVCAVAGVMFQDYWFRRLLTSVKAKEHMEALTNDQLG